MERRTDSNGNGSISNAQQGDLASKGDPAQGLGKADYDHRISNPAADTQTQIAAKSKKKKPQDNQQKNSL